MYDPNNIESSIPKSDFTLPKLLGAIAGVSLLAFGVTKYLDSSSVESQITPVIKKPSTPSDIQVTLEKLGLDAISSFTAQGINAHGIIHEGQPMVAYEIPGTDNFIIGDMFSKHGSNLSVKHRQDSVTPHIGGQAWPHLENSDYVIDQENTEGPVLYTITDPNCPYCLRLWETLSPLVEAGDIQVRHMIVGILGEDSLRKAAAILEAGNSSKTLHEYQSARSFGDDYALADPSQESIDRVLRNNDLMRKAGASGTPASYIKYPDGYVEYISGAFGAGKVNEIMEKYKEQQ